MVAKRTTYRAKWPDRPATSRSVPAPVLAKAYRVDERRMVSRAVLSAPFPDHAGDIVNPSGIDCTLHRRDPYIDLEHGRDPYIKGLPVAWATPDFGRGEGAYGFHIARLNFGDDSAPDWRDAAISTSYFDPSDKVSTQVFALVEQDVLPAVSIEFSPKKGFYKSIGWSRLERRPAYRFDACDLLRWSICERGVLPQALTGVAKSLPQVPRPLDKILEDRRVNVGGTEEELCEVIYKALAPHTPPAKRATVRVENKAMPYPPQATAAPQQQTAPAPVEDANLTTENEEAVETDDAPASGGVAAKLEFVQAVSDACEMYQQNMQSSDHPGLRAAADGDIEAVMKLLAKIKARAEKHDAKLNGGGFDDDEDEEEKGDDEEAGMDADDEFDTDADDEEDDADEEGEGKKKKKPPFAKALEFDECGVLVTCRPHVYYKGLYEGHVRRFTAAQLADGAPPPAARRVKKAPTPPATETEDPADAEYLREQQARLQRNLKLFT